MASTSGRSAASCQRRTFAKRRGRGDSLFLARGDDAEEAPIAHDSPHARHRLDPPAVECLKDRAIRRRPQNAAVQHAGQLEVVHIDAGASHLVRQVDPGQRTCRPASAGQHASAPRGRPRPLQDRPRHSAPNRSRSRCSLPVDGPIAHKQLVNTGVEPSRRCLEEGVAYFGAGLPQRAAAVDGRPAAGGNALVRAAAGIGWDHADAGVVDVQLFRRDLRQGEVMPWPISTLPVRTSTTPSVLISTHRSSRLLRARLGEANRSSSHPPLLPIYLARASDRAQDAVVGAASAQMDIQLGTDLRLRRRRIAAEQRRGAHDDAGQAVAALARLLIDKGLLQRMRPRLAAQPLDRGDLPALHRRYRGVAGLDAAPVQQHRAASAHARAATEPGTFELQVVAQDVDERRARRLP